ncbi:hypothetical protein [Granulicella mallensis]|uniref:Uncharacterized protein n=1 Tax=Granulicella mallensis (strain ATCC BAA-1857 / DSM 23137 / MP5ACTX8) TaxID=682795 RepID=G8NS53_GRAMM|nr:hypothetical protein [Granulicella mallensis]AEU36261.1 hypothetical protein AciX8_1930 [Granulicella mallensis MP5ACTX8]
MFKELSPLLRQRAVLLTVTRLEEDEIRVEVSEEGQADDDEELDEVA